MNRKSGSNWLRKIAITILVLWALGSLTFILLRYRRKITGPGPRWTRIDDNQGDDSNTGLLDVVDNVFKPKAPESQGQIAEREAVEDEEYFSKIDEDLKSRGITHERYLMMFPAFGPNNQYLATSELMIWAKTLRRTIVLPDYVAHKKLGPKSVQPFNMTFDPEPFHKWYKTITLEEYKKRCNNQIEVATYLHEPGGFWTVSMNNYCERTGLKRPLKEIPTRPQNPNSQYKKPDYFTLEDITKYWSEWDNVTCMALAFPFRHLWGERMERRMFNTAKYFDHSKNIKELAAAAQKDMGTEPGKYLAIHWRDSEEGCYSETPDMHEGYDFCTGAGAYHWGKISDFIEVLGKLIKDLNVSVIYLATDSKREEVIDRLRENLPLKVFDDVATLRQIDENYYLSLVEQEIAQQATFFLGTELSTWSEFILHRMAGLDQPLDRYANVHWLFEWNKKPFMRHDVWNHVIGKSPGSWVESQNILKFGNAPTYSCPNMKNITSNARTYNICLNDKLNPATANGRECNIISARRKSDEWDLERKLLDEFPHCKVLYLNPDFSSLPSEGLPSRMKFEKLLLDSREYPAPPRERKLLQTVMSTHNIPFADLLIMELDRREWFILNKLMRFKELQSRVGETLIHYIFFPISLQLKRKAALPLILVLVGNMSPLWDDEKQCHDAECYAYARDFMAHLPFFRVFCYGQSLSVLMEKLESEHNYRHGYFQDKGKIKQFTFVNLDQFDRSFELKGATLTTDGAKAQFKAFEPYS